MFRVKLFDPSPSEQIRLSIKDSCVVEITNEES